MTIDELKELDAKATPGPWGATPMVPKAENYFYLVGNREGNNAEKEIGTIGPCLAPSTAANAALIVALRNDALRIITQQEAEIERLREAVTAANAAMSEYYRYWTGGETRGSYDGKPERAGLWSAMYKTRAALENRNDR